MRRQATTTTTPAAAAPMMTTRMTAAAASAAGTTLPHNGKIITCNKAGERGQSGRGNWPQFDLNSTGSSWPWKIFAVFKSYKVQQSAHSGLYLIIYSLSFSLYLDNNLSKYSTKEKGQKKTTKKYDGDDGDDDLVEEIAGYIP